MVYLLHWLKHQPNDAELTFIAPVAACPIGPHHCFQFADAIGRPNELSTVHSLAWCGGETVLYTTIWSLNISPLNTRSRSRMFTASFPRIILALVITILLNELFISELLPVIHRQRILGMCWIDQSPIKERSKHVHGMIDCLRKF